MNTRTVSLIVLVALIVGGIFFLGDNISNSDSDNDDLSEVELFDGGMGQDMGLEGLPDMGNEPAQYAIQSASSTLVYTGAKVVGNSHTGNVTVKSGDLSYDGEKFTGGSFVVDMTTITESNGVQGWIDHANSDDFFAVATYPEAVFKITSVEGEAPDYMITGDLTIKDQTHTITFPAQAYKDGDVINAAASFEINRTDWGITFWSGSFFENLGDNIIKDEIQFDIRLSFTAQS